MINISIFEALKISMSSYCSIWKVFFLFIFCFQGMLWGQEEKQFSGAYNLSNGTKGSVELNFKNQRKPENFHGTFQFISLPERIDNQFGFIEINGVYASGLKQGNWSFSNKTLQPKGGFYVEGYELKKLTDGKEYLIEGNFNKGIAQGKWMVKKQVIKNSEVTQSNFSATTNLTEGQFSGAFSAQCDSISLEGTIDEEDFFTGDLIFDHLSSGLKEVRVFLNGMMVGHFLEKNGKKFNIIHLGLEDKDSTAIETVEMGEVYFNAIYHSTFGIEDGQLNEIDPVLITSQANSFLNYSVNAFLKYDGNRVWEMTPGSEPIRLPKFKLFHFPFEKGEKNEIGLTIQKLNNIISQQREFLEDAQVNINRYAYKEVSRTFAIYQEYQKQLKKVQNTLNLMILPSFEYINRDEVLPSFFSGAVLPDELVFEYKGNSIHEKINFPKNLEADDISAKKMMEWVLSVEDHMNEINENVGPVLKRIKQKEAIATKEKYLVTKKDSIFLLFNNQNNNNKFQEQYANSTVQEVDRVFKDYAEKAIEHRVNEVDDVINCMENFMAFYSLLEKLPEKLDYIEEMYTRMVWNPFTFTDMKETVKERVFNAYENYLLPFVFKELEEGLNCEAISDKMKNIELLMNKMKKLRNEDTSELEKSLKRNSDVEKIIEAFDLKFK